jgi:aryl-alcohol dehydrogenase-like predicted oxidoreductase
VFRINRDAQGSGMDLHFAKGSAVEALNDAKQQGKVRFVGFTGHKSPAMHLKILAHDYPFDTVQLPLNCFDATYRSFELQVLPELQQQGSAALGMKSLGGDGQPILYGVVRAEEALRYAMSLSVATTICGIDSLDVLHQNVKIARGFKPLLTSQEMHALRERSRPSSGNGHLELYKTTKNTTAKLGESSMIIRRRNSSRFEPTSEVLHIWRDVGSRAGAGEVCFRL